MAATVHKLTGLKINHVLYVDLAGFQGVIDTLGGVQMCIPPENVNTPDGRIVDELTALDVEPGCQTLPGDQALAYVRTRHLRCDAAAPDFYRIARQQQFLRAVINRLLEPEQLAQLPVMIKPIMQNLRRDEDLKLADLAFLVGQLEGISTGTAEFRTVPSFPDPANLGILRMDESAERIFAAIRDGKPLGEVGRDLVYTPPSEANVPVLVVDHASGGSGGRGAGGALAGRVRHLAGHDDLDRLPQEGGGKRDRLRARRRRRGTGRAEVLPERSS